MSGIPLPTAGCKCDTCEWLRKHGVSDVGIGLAPSPPNGPAPVVCPRCGLTAPLTGFHACPIPP